jgi:hypothetical protein
MDLALYARVLWRFRLIVLAGLLLAVVLALLSFVRVSLKGGSPSFAYRQAEAWGSDTRLRITGKQGFPEGSAYLPGSTATGVPTADFSVLAITYAQFANGDAVQGILARDRSLRGSMTASYAVDPVTDNPLAVLVIRGIASTPEMASRISTRGSAAFRTYLDRRERNAGIRPKLRVALEDLNAATPALLITKRKKTVPIVIFLTVMTAAIGLAFVFENLRPRIRLVESRPEADLPRSHRDTA